MLFSTVTSVVHGAQGQEGPGQSLHQVCAFLLAGKLLISPFRFETVFLLKQP